MRSGAAELPQVCYALARRTAGQPAAQPLLGIVRGVVAIEKGPGFVQRTSLVFVDVNVMVETVVEVVGRTPILFSHRQYLGPRVVYGAR
ncbi:MAG: hypothetical protein QOK44_3190 [Betaproteobacteria bacterium]|nr:hypothetical protein [Betaproteobacteria bacterium]